MTAEIVGLVRPQHLIALEDPISHSHEIVEDSDANSVSKLLNAANT